MFRSSMYPTDLSQFEAWFKSDQACREYLEVIRWPNGFKCPKCLADRYWSIGKRGVKECVKCHHQTSVTAGTIFEGTRKPLVLWFLAMWLFTTEKGGFSAKELQKKLGFSRYETAWTWLYKLRYAMVCPELDCLQGIVEVLQVHVGVRSENSKAGKAWEQCVFIAAEITEHDLSRVRVQKQIDISHANLAMFVQNVVSIGSLIQTYGWEGVSNIEKIGYTHQDFENIEKRDQSNNRPLPYVHQVARLLKQWLQSRPRGGAREKHLDYYLDEFTFRLNHRKSEKRGELFHHLVQQAVQVDPITWDKVIGH